MAQNSAIIGGTGRHRAAQGGAGCCGMLPRKKSRMAMNNQGWAGAKMTKKKAKSRAEGQEALDAALRDAVARGDNAAVDECLGQGANPRGIGDDELQRNALMVAAFEDNERCLRIFMAKGGAKDVNSKGETALMVAAWRGSRDCLRLLLPRSDARAQDNEGWSALMWAVRRNRAPCVEDLLPKSQPDAQDRDGWTALMLAAHNSHLECLDLLLPVSNPSLKNEHGNTALAAALQAAHLHEWGAAGGDEDDGAIDCARRLLAVSDLDAENNEGQSALALAQALKGEKARKLAQEMLALSERRALAREVAEVGHAQEPQASASKALRRL